MIDIPNSFRIHCSFSRYSCSPSSGIDPDGNIPFSHAGFSGFCCRFKLPGLGTEPFFSASGIGIDKETALKNCFCDFIREIGARNSGCWAFSVPEEFCNDIRQSILKLEQGNPSVIREAYRSMSNPFPKDKYDALNKAWNYEKIG